MRGWRTWAELARLLGVAYLIGFALVGVEATLVLVAGGGLPTLVVIGLSLGSSAAASLFAWRRKRPLPRAGGFALPSRSLGNGVAAVAAGLTVALLVDYWRVARHQGLIAYDAWGFWVPKAKAIYFFHGLDTTIFTTMWGPSYPLLVPALQAMDFHLMGSADQSTIAVQYWFLLAGFVAAVAGLLKPYARSYFVWPFLAMAVAMPELDKRFLGAQADWPLDVIFALAALTAALWLVTREGWLLGCYAVFLAAEIATKREGQLLAACLVVALVAVTWRERRSAWPRIAGLAAAAYAVNIPWRIWWESRHLLSDMPNSGIGKLADTAPRVGPALGIVFRLLFDYNLWLLAVPLAVVAAAALLFRRDVSIAVVFLLTSLLACLGFVWVLWAFPDLPLDTSQHTPVPRLVGSVVLLSITFSPLLLARLSSTEAHGVGKSSWACILRSNRWTSPRFSRAVAAAESERSE